MRAGLLRGTVCVLALLPSLAMAESVEGRLQWSGVKALGLNLSGVVAQVHVSAGQTVAAGTSLLELDPTPFQSRRDQAAAGLERIRPGYEEAEAELARAQDLLDRTVISEADFRVADITFRQARADFQAAEARLALAEWELSRSRLPADRALRVLSVHVEPGQAVNGEFQVQRLFTVADADRLLAVAELSHRQVETVRPGMSATVRLGRSKSTGEVVGIEFQDDAPLSRRYRVSVRFVQDADSRPDLDEKARIDLP